MTQVKYDINTRAKKLLSNYLDRFKNVVFTQEGYNYLYLYDKPKLDWCINGCDSIYNKFLKNGNFETYKKSLQAWYNTVELIFKKLYSPAPPQKIQQIHILKNKKNLSDKQYRLILRRVSGGKNSSKALNFMQIEEAIIKICSEKEQPKQEIVNVEDEVIMTKVWLDRVIATRGNKVFEKKECVLNALQALLKISSVFKIDASKVVQEK